MTDPIIAVATLQSAMIDGWFRTAQAMTKCWRHGCESQLRLLSAGHHRCRAQCPSGPSLTDQYGRRCHDIDPERDV